ncbi:hypothetical protein IW261DRAFT_1527602, partial [Armillaria novae-zelandiae]
MAVPILPNNFNPLSRPPLNPTQPLPWPDCYHPTLTVTHCHIRNDLIVWDPWLDPKYQTRTTFGELQLSSRTSVKHPRLLCLFHRNTTPKASTMVQFIKLSKPVELRLSYQNVLPRLLDKISRCIPCLHPDLENYNRDLFDDPLQGFDLFGATPPDTMPVIEVIEDIESVKQINVAWNFFRELDALKRIEVDYHKRMKAKVQADIDRTCEKDEGLYTHLQAKLRKRKHERLP